MIPRNRGNHLRLVPSTLLPADPEVEAGVERAKVKLMAKPTAAYESLPGGGKKLVRKLGAFSGAMAVGTFAVLRLFLFLFIARMILPILRLLVSWVVPIVVLAAALMWFGHRTDIAWKLMAFGFGGLVIPWFLLDWFVNLLDPTVVPAQD